MGNNLNNKKLLLLNIKDMILEHAGLVLSIIGIDGFILIKHFKELAHFSLLSMFLIILSSGLLGFCLAKKLTVKWLVNLSFLYLIYLVISYLITITLNLNNSKFAVWAILKNGFFQVNTLFSIFLIVIIAFLKKRFDNQIRKKQRDISLGRKNLDLKLFAGFLTLFFLTDHNFLASLQHGLGDFHQLSYVYPFLSYIIGETILAYLVVFNMTHLALKSGLEFSKWHFGFPTAITLSLLLAFIYNWWFQLGVRVEGDLLGYFDFPGANIFQITFLCLIFLTMYLLVNHVVLPTFLIILLSSGLAVANLMKQRFREEPILVTDFTWLQEPKILLGFLDRETVVAFLILLLIVVCLIYANLFFLPSDKLKLSLKKRLVYFSIIAVLFTGTFQVFKHHNKKGEILSGIPVISKLNNFRNINWMGFYTNAAYRSVAFVWMQQLTSDMMSQPKDYSQAKIEALVKKYTKRAQEINMTRENDIRNETVVYVLSESLSNPNRVAGTELSQNPLTYIDSIKSETTSGLMHSDGYGGGTANMEFQTLTGLPFYNYSDTVSVLYSEVFPKMKVHPVISDQFKSSNRYVVHPSGGNNYNRNNIYGTLGFNHRYFLTDSQDILKDMAYEGVSVSDESVYQKVLDLANNGESQFFSVITMQNHVPWSEANPEELTVDNKQLNKDENDQLTNYSKLLQHTDVATQHFLEGLSNIDKSVTVVFYGDHLPGIYPKKVFKENPESQYLTDYFIWNNKQDNKLNYPIVNSSDFIATLFAHQHLKVSPYYALLTDVLDNASVDKSDFDKNQEQIAEDLKLIQYDISNGDGFLKENPTFFKLLD